MKIGTRIALAVVAVGLLAALGGCDLYNGINLAWNVTGWGPAAPGVTRVTYTAQNLGKFDLTSVNLQIGVDVTGNRTYPIAAWTSNFDVKQNQLIYGSIDIFTGASAAYGATVLSVDMAKPLG